MRPKYLAVAIVCCLLATSVGTTVYACHACHQPACCCPAPPPPPPVKVTLCVKDPCSCCTYEVDVCIPACCSAEQACVEWRSGFFGRRIATYCWPCCDHSVEVVVTRHGKAFAR
jgi:hypothetical protein